MKKLILNILITTGIIFSSHGKNSKHKGFYVKKALTKKYPNKQTIFYDIEETDSKEKGKKYRLTVSKIFNNPGRPQTYYNEFDIETTDTKISLLDEKKKNNILNCFIWNKNLKKIEGNKTDSEVFVHCQNNKK